MYKKNNTFKNIIVIIMFLKLLQEQEKEFYMRELQDLIYLISIDFQENKNQEEILNEPPKICNEDLKKVNNISTSNDEKKAHNLFKKNKIKKIKKNISGKNISYNIKSDFNKETYKNIKKKYKIKKLVSNNKNIKKYALKYKKNNDNHIQCTHNIFVDIPIVISDLQVELTDKIVTSINEGFLNINEIKNNIFIEEAYVMKLDFNSAKLYLKGYIRSYIEYITLDRLEDNMIFTKNKGVIDYKDFNINKNINFIFSSKLGVGETFPIYFYSDFKGKNPLNSLRGSLEKVDIKSCNVYKPIIKNQLDREQTYVGIEQNLLIKINLHITENNIVIL